jgi:dTDP-4-dehydrorhamnose 3,5-epimerase-like enzyme
VGDDVVIGPNATFSNEAPSGGVDKRDAHAFTRIGQGATIGANATVLAGLTIGQYAVIRPGAVVTHIVPAYAIISGNPSQIVGYVGTSRREPEKLFSSTQDETPIKLRVKGAGLVHFAKVVDMRGMTTFAEFDKHLPFVATRFFVVRDVPSREVRGEHAHKTLHEFLVCLKGSFAVMLDDGFVRDEVAMDSPTLGLHVPPQVWRVVYKFSPDAVMLSLCSHVYDPDDYIRDYSEFLAFVGVR